MWVGIQAWKIKIEVLINGFLDKCLANKLEYIFFL